MKTRAEIDALIASRRAKLAGVRGGAAAQPGVCKSAKLADLPTPPKPAAAVAPPPPKPAACIDPNQVRPPPHYLKGEPEPWRPWVDANGVRSGLCAGTGYGGVDWGPI
jgi:hypothetical protein